MRKLLILTTLILAGCASSTPKNDALELRVLSYISGPTKTQYARLAPIEAREVTYLGLQKLPLEDLYHFNYLQLILMESSAANCNAIVANSSADASEEKDIGLDSLTDEEYDEYARILAKMITLGTDYNLRTYPTPSKEQFNEAVKIVMANEVSAPTSSRLRNARRKSGSNQERCLTYQKIANYIDEKRDPTAETLVRYLSLNYINFKRFSAPAIEL